MTVNSRKKIIWGIVKITSRLSNVCENEVDGSDLTHCIEIPTEFERFEDLEKVFKNDSRKMIVKK